MTTFQKIVCWLILIGIVVGGVGLVTLNQNIENLQFAIGNLDFAGQAGYVDNFNEEYLAELMQQQNALFSSLKQELRAPDAEAFQVTLAVTVHPKEYTKNSTAQLVYKDQTVPMEFSNGTFAGEIAIPLDLVAGEAEYMVLLETDGVIRSQSAPLNLTGFACGAEVFGWNETMSSSGSATHHLDIALKFDKSLLPFADEVDSARVYAKKIDNEGKELFSEKMNGSAVQLKQAISGAPGEEVVVYGEVLGQSGLTYLYAISRISFHDDLAVEETYSEDMIRIIGPQGQELELETKYS